MECTQGVGLMRGRGLRRRGHPQPASLRPSRSPL
jgi:hypothetical protein